MEPKLIIITLKLQATTCRSVPQCRQGDTHPWKRPPVVQFSILGGHLESNDCY